MIHEITSLQHPIVKHFVKLRNSRAFRKEQKAALIVGTKLVSELSSSLNFKTFFIEKGAEPLSIKADRVFVVTSGILKKITGMEQPEPYAAEIALPESGHLEGKRQLLVLDGIADPGNLGTLLRSALALGWDGVFICEGSADPYNEKALRAAKGATFHLSIREGTHEELEELIKKEGFSIYSADLKGKTVDAEKIHTPIALVLGNESHGVRFRPQAALHKLTIPMHEKMESLNVGVAGSILMYLLRQQR